MTAGAHDHECACPRCRLMRSWTVVIPDEPADETERQQVLKDVSAEVLGRIGR